MKSKPIMLLFTVITLALASTSLAQDWVAQSSGTSIPLTGVWFTNAQNGWAVGDLGTSIRTTDGGSTWTSFILTAQDLQSVAFKDPSIGLIVGDNGTIFRTSDGGASWAPVGSGTSSNLAAVGFGAGQLAYAAGRDGVILRSNDSGASWTLVETGDNRYRDLFAVGTKAWIVGNDGVYKSSIDGGVTWSEQILAGGSDLKGVFFLDELEGWAGGQNSTLIYTSNGGATWNPRSTNINVGIDAVQFVNSSEGWAVGNLGTIYLSLDGGLSWLAEPSGTSNELNNLYFLGSALGWAVGDLGTILVRSIPTSVPGQVPLASLNISGHPNPFNPSTTLSLKLPASGVVQVEILDLRGRRVKLLQDGHLSEGLTEITWTGRDDAGRLVGSGVYFARVSSSGGSETTKLVLSK